MDLAFSYLRSCLPRGVSSFFFLCVTELTTIAAILGYVASATSSCECHKRLFAESRFLSTFIQVCRGIDYCANVTCPAPATCRLTGVCSHGICSYPFEDKDTPCSDGRTCRYFAQAIDLLTCESSVCFLRTGNPLTDLDACDGAGNCVGVYLCDVLNVTCQPLSQVSTGNGGWLFSPFVFLPG